MGLLDVTGVTKSFGTTPVLRGVDLQIPDGCLAAVLGPSGCGKTTLLRVVAGFERADAGLVDVGGRRLADGGRTHVAPERRGIGIVPQEGALFPHMSVAKNVEFGLRGGRDARLRSAEVLELVGLAGYGGRMPHELSGGQQQRVALARALAPEPSLILLDEPFNALDPGLRATLRQEVRGVLRAAGVTALMVTHDREEAMSMADLVALMRDGRVAQSGAPREVYERPADAELAAYIGETVVLPGEFRAGRVHCALGRLAPVEGMEVPAGRCDVVLRPERLVLGTDADEGALAVVKDVTFAGHDTVVELALDGDGTELWVRSHVYPAPLVGETVRVHLAGAPAVFPTSELPARGILV